MRFGHWQRSLKCSVLHGPYRDSCTFYMYGVLYFRGWGNTGWWFGVITSSLWPVRAAWDTVLAALTWANIFLLRIQQRPPLSRNKINLILILVTYRCELEVTCSTLAVQIASYLWYYRVAPLTRA
jgi:hypothetical protein